MDHNDNDYEGHNLQLTGEESSKISSVLPPFALPKFDFDDSLHGHLRFDSLVENEVFLGIPNQEDNQWIEDYSRGGNGIEFSSTAAESCALPRHVNVWSEATSSESVEMLLKAVGQEEMVQGENVEESNSGIQLAGSTEQTENNLRQHDTIENVDHQNSLLTATDVEGDISKSHQSVGLESAGTEYTLQVNFSSSEECVNSKDINLAISTEHSNADMKMTSDTLEGPSGLVNESVSGQVQGDPPLLGTEINFTQNYSQKDVTGSEFVDQDKISGIGFVNSSSIAQGISDSIRELEEGCKENDEKLDGISVETDSHLPCGNPSKVESSKEEHAVEICDFNSEEVSDVLCRGKSVSTGGIHEAALIDEPAESCQHDAVVLSSGAEPNQFYKAHSIVHEGSSVCIEGEGKEGLGKSGRDDANSIIDGKTKVMHPINQQSDQCISLGGNEDGSFGSDNSLAAPVSTVKFSDLHEVLGNPSEQAVERKFNPADDPDIPKDSTISVKCQGEKSVADDHGRDSLVSPKEILMDKDQVPSPAPANSEICKENIIPVQVDAQVNGLVVYDENALGEKDKKLPLDSSYTASDGISGGVKVETTTGSQPNSSTGDYPVLNSEGKDTKSTSSGIEANDLVDCHELSAVSLDEECIDHSKDTKSDAHEQPSTLASFEILKSTEIVRAVEIEKGVDSLVEGTRVTDLSISVTSSVEPHAASMELNKTSKLSAGDVTVPLCVPEAAATENPTDEEKENNHTANSSIPSVASCTVKVDRSFQAADLGTSCTDLSQNERNKNPSLERINTKNSRRVSTKSKLSGGTTPSRDEGGTFTFEIRPLEGQSTEDSSVGLQSFPRIQACRLAVAGEGSALSSGSSQTNAVTVTKGSHVSSLTASVCPPSGGTPERKPRRSNSKTGRGSVKKANQVKETTPLNTEKGGKSPQLLSPLGASQLMAFESVLKPRGAVSISMSSLPDLNSSTPSSSFFQQPFTDLQQMQLRAQIFVYGSLIQGVAPDEACMISAFGTGDGGRSNWEPSWHACVERLQRQKSQGNNNETPLASRTGVKAADQTKRQSSHEVTSQGGIKGTQSPAANPMMPLSSPLWNMVTPSSEALTPSSMTKSSPFDYQAVSPLNSSQFPPVRNYMAHSSGPVQASFPVPWLASSRSSPFDISTSYPSFTITEPIKLTPVKETSLPVTAGTKLLSPLPASLTAATTVFVGTPSLDSKKVKASSGPTAEAKSRKRKMSSSVEILQIPATVTPVDNRSGPMVANQLSTKIPAVGGLNQMPLISQNQVNLMPKPIIESHYTASVAVATSSSLISKSTSNQLLSVVPSSTGADRPNRGDFSIYTQNIEGFSKVKEATLQAEEAAAHATAALNHCEGIWSQLDQQKNSDLTSETEYKLASAAVAIAAAASVAKAAAAAAKIASNAALEAKRMADEDITRSGMLNTTDYDANSVSNAMKLANASPLSFLQVGNGNNGSSFVIAAAREAASKRIDASSAATRRAENLDAIVKAAELAAEAVSHAGKIVTMDTPYSLSELVMAGPNNYWKGSQVAAPPLSKPEENKSINGNAGEVSNVYINQHTNPDVDVHVTGYTVPPIERGSSTNLEPDHITVEDSLIASVNNEEKGSRPQNDKRALNGSVFAGVVSDTGTAPNVKEGSYVEVLRNPGDLKAWFTATVLSMKDAEALVCYNELKSDEGPDLLKEWISLEAKDGNAPKIRIPHPTTTVQFEGTRKRRRAAVRDYSWSLGDRVDAWVQDCWREGCVREKNTKDATTLSIHFPDTSETLAVKIWHLRPTLIWSDGEWTEWCRPGDKGTSQGDTPDEKRTRVGGTSLETRGGAAKGLNFGERLTIEKPGLPLSANEKVFSIGSTGEQKKSTTIRSKRSGPEKEKPGVVIGVPKPGKKRKFMEVSKHYVSSGGTSKVNIPSDSMTLAKLLDPQGSGAWGTRNKSKPDAKGKQIAESKTRRAKSGKPPNIPKNVSRKVGLASSLPSEHDAIESNQAMTGSMSNDENESAGQNLTEFGSLSNIEETSEDTAPSSSQDLPESQKKVTDRNTKSKPANQGKAASPSEEPVKDEANEAWASQVTEPRRSHRRIQPTSRLLEGLQSSMTIPKFPSISHDKGPRSHKKRPNQRE